MILKLSSILAVALASVSLANTSPVNLEERDLAPPAACTFVVSPSGTPDLTEPLFSEWNYSKPTDMSQIPLTDSRFEGGNSTVTGPDATGLYTVEQTLAADVLTTAEVIAIATGWAVKYEEPSLSGTQDNPLEHQINAQMPGGDVQDDFSWVRYEIGSNYVFVCAVTLLVRVDSGACLDIGVGSAVSIIWKEKWRTGSILFLLVRYSVPLQIPFDILPWFPTGTHITSRMCNILYTTGQVMVGIRVYSATASILLCLYALIGSKLLHLWILATAYFLCPCMAQNEKKYLMAISAYTIVARELIMTILAAAAMYVRYRHQNNSLIKVIRRDLGVYYGAIMGQHPLLVF
ncbi:hypothetical protein H1R20_g9728, partial [Candolleomyces eurysporus]